MPENGYFTKEMLHELDEMTKQSYLRSQGLLDPPLTQLWNFVRQLFSGDLGRSLTVYPKVPIATILSEKNTGHGGVRRGQSWYWAWCWAYCWA